MMKISPTTPAPPAATGYLEVLRQNPNYRSLWMGEVISLFGDWFNLIASASLISSLTGSGMALGGLFVVRMLAPFLVSPIAGVLADRYDRRKLLIASDLIRAVVVLGFLLVRDAGDVWLLYALTAVQLGVSGFFFPARNAILPEIVRRGELGAANALSSITWSVMLAVGSAVGGLVAGGWGIYPAFVVDAVTFLLSAFFIARIVYRPGEEALAAQAAGTSLRAGLAQYTEGLGYLKHHPDVFALTLHKSAFGLLSNGVFQVVQVLLAEQIFVIGHNGGISLGLLYAAAGVGNGLGPVIARRFTGDRDRPMRIAMALAYLVSAVGLIILAPLPGFFLVLFGTFLRAYGGGINWVFSTQLLLQTVPGRVRGRVFSTDFALFTLAQAVSTGLGGWLFDSGLLTGTLEQKITAVMLVSSAIILLPAALWALWIARRGNQTQPEPE